MAFFFELIKQLTKQPATEYPQADEQPLEGIRGKPQISDEKCIRCGLCERNCPCQAIVIGKPRTEEFSLIYLDKCVFCGLCEELCPVDAIKLSHHYEVSTERIEDLSQKQ